MSPTPICPPHPHVPDTHMSLTPTCPPHPHSAVFSGGTGGARAPPEFGGSQKGRSLISAYQSLAITTNTPRFEKLNTALPHVPDTHRSPSTNVPDTYMSPTPTCPRHPHVPDTHLSPTPTCPPHPHVPDTHMSPTPTSTAHLEGFSASWIGHQNTLTVPWSKYDFWFFFWKNIFNELTF